MEPEPERQHAQGELARLVDLGQRRDADPGDHRTTDEIRFRGEAHGRSSLLCRAPDHRKGAAPADSAASGDLGPPSPLTDPPRSGDLTKRGIAQAPTRRAYTRRLVLIEVA